MNVLIIDDSMVVRAVIRRMLAQKGHEVVEAADGQVALELLGSGVDPDLILVDWNMPGISGLDFLQTVRQPPYSLRAKIVMVTTETDAANVVRALSAGADEYLMKPFTPDAMTEKLQILGLEA